MRKIAIETAEVLTKKKHAHDSILLILGPFSRAGSIKPGQFVHIKINHSDIFFRRAFSVYDINPRDNSFSILFKVYGRGTARLAEIGKGEKLNIMGPLGNSFTLPSRREISILAGGGIGMPPIYLLAKQMVEKGYDRDRIWFFYGGKTKNELIELPRLKKLGVNLICTTDDGSYGFKGLVGSAVKEAISGENNKYRIYACGPQGMLKAIDSLARKSDIPGQLSLEAPMPCGIGICLGCIVPLRAGGHSRVCRDGPIYNIGEVLL